MIDLKGKKALVTGGSSGIGKDICEKLAACGADILINYHRKKDAAYELADKLRRQYRVNTHVVQADISSETNVRQMFSEMDEKIGSIELLVNNAGYETVEHCLDLSMETWDRVFDINLKGAFMCTQEAGRRMCDNGGGTIINISSIHDKVPRKGLIHYCASKAAMNMMTKCLALELAEDNIRVLTISPGAIETEMNKKEIEKFGRDKFEQWIPAARVGLVDDVSWACAFLASEMGAYITATELYIDGGYKEHTIQYDPRPARKSQ